MRIYIRHGEKIYNSEERDCYKYDPGITSDSKSDAMFLAEKLIEKYGVPSHIISSPFLRTRETAMTMLEVVKNHIKSDSMEIKIDIKLSPYLAKSVIRNNDIRKETMLYSSNFNETPHQLRVRLYNHINNHSYLDNSGIPVWYISHNTIIKRICNYNYYMCDNLNFLECIIFEGERGKISNGYKYNNIEIKELILNQVYHQIKNREDYQESIEDHHQTKYSGDSDRKYSDDRDMKYQDKIKYVSDGDRKYPSDSDRKYPSDSDRKYPNNLNKRDHFQKEYNLSYMKRLEKEIVDIIII